MRLRCLIVLMAAAVSLASCSQEPEYTDKQRVCIARLFPDFDAKKLSSCVDACKFCMRGNDVTCNTSCKLRGAS